jgi:L,D-transpeptidase YcbB
LTGGALSLLSLVSNLGPAQSQGTPEKSAHASALDAGPSTPDPLAPPDVNAPARAAPNAPSSPPEAAPAAESVPVVEVDPIVTLVRQRLSAAPAGANPDDYAALAAFYAARTGLAVWTSKDGLTPRAKQAIEELRKADDWGLKASAFDVPAPLDGSATVEALADAEIKLGFATLKYGRHAAGGRLDPPSISKLFDQKPTLYDPKGLIQAIAASDGVDVYLRGLHPKHPQFERLRQAMLAARGVKSDDPAPAVKIPAGPTIKPGQEHAQVPLLRQRMATAAASDGKEQFYDDALAAAVKAVQVQAGMEPTGVINAATRNALNGVERPTSASNVQRIIVNMERWRWMPENLGSFYVWDSVTEQMTSVFDEGKQVLSEKIVVGKPSSPTVIFSADMQFIIFHPSWGVPPGMKSYELAPLLRNAGGGWFFSSGASAVLRGYNLQVSRGGRPVDPDSVNWASADIHSYDFVQPPGPTNVLGMVKFRFPNKHDIYMHDTPERHLFGGAVRAFSHGCMRVQNPVKLAEVLLAHDKGWSVEQVQENARRGGEIKLTTPIPVHVSYFTADVDDAGKLHFRPDIYALDSRVASKLEGQSVNLVTSAIDKPEAGERSAATQTGEQPARAKARAKQKAANSQPFNPFSSIFGN